MTRRRDEMSEGEVLLIVLSMAVFGIVIGWLMG